MDEPTGKTKSGLERAKSLTSERRREIAMLAVEAKRQKSEMPRAEYEGKLKIGDAELDVAVLKNQQRIITLTAVFKAFDRPIRGNSRLINVPVFMDAKNLQPFVGEDLRDVIKKVQYVNLNGKVQEGYDATILPLVSDLYLKAREEGKLSKAQEGTAKKAEIMVRSLAKVGIVALVDEATGYQRDRAKDALAKILESFVAKELQPYVKTFPPDYYEQLFRLRDLPYPPEVSNFRPQYFGKLTNDIIYKRLAPGLLKEIKLKNDADEKKGKLFQRLTLNVGYQKLRDHIAGVIMAMKLSKDYPDFINKLNSVYPRYGDTLLLDLEDKDKGH